MNIVFLTLTNFNSIHDNSIYTDLLREFARNDHNIYVVSPTERRTRKQTYIIDEDICKILKVEVGNIQKTNIFEKGISTILLESQYIKAIKKYFHSVYFDLVIYSTPPITLANVVNYLKKRDKSKSYLLLKDIFPQNAIDLGMLSETGIKGIVYRYFLNKEKQLYLLSDYIGCMSKANVEFILKNNSYISEDIVEVCPNSIEPKEVEKDDTKIKGIRKMYNIPFDKTVFLYGGNIGKPQGIDFLIECLKKNITNNHIHFLIVGAGTEYKKLKSYIDCEKPANVQLFSFLPKPDYDSIVSSCDVGLIFLDNRFTIPNFPSRLLAYMQASMPVLAATDKNTDIGKVIVDGGFGMWCESKNIEDFNNNLRLLCDEETRKKMGANARDYLEKNYTVKHSYKIIMNHFKQEVTNV